MKITLWHRMLISAFLLVITLMLAATEAAACCDPPENGCCGSPATGCFKCASGGSRGGGGGGETPPGPPPPNPDPGDGSGAGNPPPAPPTPTPPPGLPTDGFYRLSCDMLIPGCPHGYSVILWWCVPGGQCYVVRARCAAAGECEFVTPTPPSDPPPEGPNDWPCQDVPNIYPGGIDQTCDQWEWDLAVQVLIPPAQVLRSPWPRALVGLPTQIWYTGQPNRAKAFSTGKAFPCSVNPGAAYANLASVPACPAPIGQPTEGTRVNLQLGVAWQRWQSGAPAVYGYLPPYESLITIEDRAWNDSAAAVGTFLQHTFETSSYDLIANGPRWNPACQDRDCTCDERVIGWDMPAYQGGVQTWWYPQWTWKYDELQCSRRTWTPCFYRDSPPVGVPARGCAEGDHAGEDNWYQLEECAEWRWRNITGPLFGCPGAQHGAWCVYDLRDLGYTPLLSWAVAETAGADAGGTQCGSFSPGLAIPVIEAQSILIPR